MTATELDDDYPVYMERVTQMVNPESYPSQIQNIQISAKFRYDSGYWQAQPLPGYTVITPPWQKTEHNTKPYRRLQALQASLAQQLPTPALALLPPASLHLTLADLICGEAYHTVQADPAIAVKLYTAIGQSFQQMESLGAIPWRIAGLTVMPQSVGVCLTPQTANAYTRILELRRAIYHHPDLTALGIRQHYHFTAHITLGYWGNIDHIESTHPAFRSHLNQILSHLTQNLVASTPETDKGLTFWIDGAELRQFEDLTQFKRHSDWPSLEF